jgi:hypothetical protein
MTYSFYPKTEWIFNNYYFPFISFLCLLGPRVEQTGRPHAMRSAAVSQKIFFHI